MKVDSCKQLGQQLREKQQLTLLLQTLPIADTPLYESPSNSSSKLIPVS